MDYDGGVHVLNRDVVSGHMQWKHYYQSSSGRPKSEFIISLSENKRSALCAWTQNPLPYAEALGRKRGVMAVTKQNDKYLILPENGAANSGDRSVGVMTVLKATKEGGFKELKLVWRGGQFSSKPRVDQARLRDDDILSLYLRKENRDNQLSSIVVVEFDLKIGRPWTIKHTWGYLCFYGPTQS